MRLTPAFVALLAITPAFCAPTPAPTGETVESLAASAKDKPVDLVKKLAPIAKEIVDLVASMSAADNQGASKSTASASASATAPEPTTSSPASTKSTASNSTAPINPPASTVDNKVEQASNSTSVDQKSSATSPLPADQTAAVAEPAATPSETGNGSLPSEEPAATSAATDSSGDSQASPAPTDSPADSADSGSIQRRDTPTSASSPAPTPTPTTSSAPAPTVNRKDILKLRQLLAKATMYEQAVESVLLAQGKNIDDRPTDKTASGVGWGLANGPIMAMLGFSSRNVVKKQPS